MIKRLEKDSVNGDVSLAFEDAEKEPAMSELYSWTIVGEISGSAGTNRRKYEEHSRRARITALPPSVMPILYTKGFNDVTHTLEGEADSSVSPVELKAEARKATHSCAHYIYAYTKTRDNGTQRATRSYTKLREAA